MLHRKSYAEIHLKNLEHNIQLIKKISGRPRFCCPMVKANAYGHGDIEVAHCLIGQGVSHLGVGLVEEAIRLRKNRITEPILVFGMFDEASCDAILEHDITPVISDFAELEYLKQKLSQLPGRRQKIHLKFNTGMNRLGLEVAQAPRLRQFLDDHKNFELEGICTHFFHGEDAGLEAANSHQQLEKLFTACKKFDAYDYEMHALGSSAIANLHFRVEQNKPLMPENIFKLGIRPGIAIYGGFVANLENRRLDLRPVMNLKSQIVRLHELRAGEITSYGGKWKATRDSLIAVVPLGYADGYFRNLSGRGEVLCHGQIVPVVGTVCMDYFMIDLTGIKHDGSVKVGDEIVLFGRQQNNQILASDLAEKIGTISYEVLTRVGERVPRIYVR